MKWYDDELSLSLLWKHLWYYKWSSVTVYLFYCVQSSGDVFWLLASLVVDLILSLIVERSDDSFIVSVTHYSSHSSDIILTEATIDDDTVKYGNIDLLSLCILTVNG